MLGRHESCVIETCTESSFEALPGTLHCLCEFVLLFRLLKRSWDLVTRVIVRVTILITPIKVLITLLTKSHDPPSRPSAAEGWGA